jgi:hypothetical protein
MHVENVRTDVAGKSERHKDKRKENNKKSSNCHLEWRFAIPPFQAAGSGPDRRINHPAHNRTAVWNDGLLQPPLQMAVSCNRRYNGGGCLVLKFFKSNIYFKKMKKN